MGQQIRALPEVQVVNESGTAQYRGTGESTNHGTARYRGTGGSTNHDTARYRGTGGSMSDTETGYRHGRTCKSTATGRPHQPHLSMDLYRSMTSGRRRLTGGGRSSSARLWSVLLG